MISSHMLMQIMLAAFMASAAFYSRLPEFRACTDSSLGHSLIRLSSHSFRSEVVSSGISFNSGVIPFDAPASNFTYVLLNITEHRNGNRTRTSEVFRLDSLNRTLNVSLKNNTGVSGSATKFEPVTLTISFDQNKNSSPVLSGSGFGTIFGDGSELELRMGTGSDFDDSEFEHPLFLSESAMRFESRHRFPCPFYTTGSEVGCRSKRGLPGVGSLRLGFKPFLLNERGLGLGNGLRYTISEEGVNISFVVGAWDAGTVLSFLVSDSSQISEGKKESEGVSGRLVTVVVLGDNLCTDSVNCYEKVDSDSEN